MKILPILDRLKDDGSFFCHNLREVTARHADRFRIAEELDIRSRLDKPTSLPPVTFSPSKRFLLRPCCDVKLWERLLSAKQGTDKTPKFEILPSATPEALYSTTARQQHQLQLLRTRQEPSEGIASRLESQSQNERKLPLFSETAGDLLGFQIVRHLWALS